MFKFKEILLFILFLFQNALSEQQTYEPGLLKISFWDGSGKIIAVTLSFLTLTTMFAGYIKKIINATNFEPRLKSVENEITEIQNTIEKNYKDIKNLLHALRLDISNKVNVNNYNELVSEHKSLEKNFSNEIIKIYNKLEQLSLIDIKLKELKQEIDTCNLSKKEEIKEINENIKTLRENIREDINEIKSIIMNILISIK